MFALFLLVILAIGPQAGFGAGIFYAIAARALGFKRCRAGVLPERPQRAERSALCKVVVWYGCRLSRPTP
jgi:hypothetical protein